ncbi:hypothetical protein ACFQO7_23725 [Catellatospora aurea]|uniref:Uncharacterized protein n=1 Tax=Catellatospora aurea TaxID=1337874 RepID=A0ABW2H4B0_9ACTN
MSILATLASVGGTVLAVLLAARIHAFIPSRDLVELDAAARDVVTSATTAKGTLRVIATAPHPQALPPVPRGGRNVADGQAVFLEFAGPAPRRGVIEVQGRDEHGFAVLAVRGAAPGKALAAVLLHLRDAYAIVPRADFAWPSGSHRRSLIRFLLLGSGHLAAVTVAVLRNAEPDPARRPRIHVGP